MFLVWPFFHVVADCRAKKAGKPKMAGAGRPARSLEQAADYKQTTTVDQSAGNIEWGCRSPEYGISSDDN